MKITENKLYFAFILIGLFYFITKVSFYYIGVVDGFKEVMIGLIATIATISIGFISFKEYLKRTNKPVAHYLTIIATLFIIIYTPVFMITKLGIPLVQFPSGKIAVLVIFECLSISQLILAIFMFRGLRLKGDII